MGSSISLLNILCRLSKVFEDTNMKTNTISTCFWMAPEFMNERIFIDKSDIYSLSILFWEIINRNTLPYKNIDQISFMFGDFSKVSLLLKIQEKTINLEI